MLHLTSQQTSISAINSYGSWTVFMVRSEMGLYNRELKICCAWKDYITGHSFSHEAKITGDVYSKMLK